MKDRVEAVLNQYVRPVLRGHTGDLTVTKIVDNTVYVRLLGQCSSCASAYYTLDELVEKELKTHIPEIKGVRLDPYSEDLLRIAKQLLNHEIRPEDASF